MKAAGNFRKFLFLWTGELISSIGGGLTSFGLGVYIFEQKGSGAGSGSGRGSACADSNQHSVLKKYQRFGKKR